MTQADLRVSLAGMDKGTRRKDSRAGSSAPAKGGGVIPGAGGSDARAFSIRAAQPSALPVLIAVPHAGRSYPPGLLERMRNPAYSALRLEDRLVDLVAGRVASATGAALIVAHAPRAMIDLNRAEDDIDWEMVARGDASQPEVSRTSGSGRARSGLGLIPRRLPGVGEVWKGRHERTEIADRIAAIHRPYHAAIAEALADMRRRWGAALLLDLHSMPPLIMRGGLPPEFVVGDRFGATCSGQLTAAMFTAFAQNGRKAAHNRPYAGGFVLERHAEPRSGIHAVQLEIARSSYLDSRLVESGPGFEPVVELLVGMVRKLAADVADLGRGARAEDWPEAAE